MQCQGMMLWYDVVRKGSQTGQLFQIVAGMMKQCLFDVVRLEVISCTNTQGGYSCWVRKILNDVVETEMFRCARKRMWKRKLKKAKRRGRPSCRLAPTSKALAPRTWSLQRKLLLPYPQWKVIRFNGKSPGLQLTP
jgi:hypothetical protein